MPPQTQDPDLEDFVRLLTEAQPRLHSYICMLLGGVQEAGNVLQETNLVLWKKADQFTPGTSFIAWAREIAYFKAMSCQRDRGRSRMILDQQRIELAVAATDAGGDDRRVALRHCLSDLQEEQLHLLKLRYTLELPIQTMGQRLGKSEGAVKMALRRVRLALMRCITQRLEAGHA